jgi:hypothetical protein
MNWPIGIILYLATGYLIMILTALFFCEKENGTIEMGAAPLTIIIWPIVLIMVVFVLICSLCK